MVIMFLFEIVNMLCILAQHVVCTCRTYATSMMSVRLSSSVSVLKPVQIVISCDLEFYRGRQVQY